MNRYARWAGRAVIVLGLALGFLLFLPGLREARAAVCTVMSANNAGPGSLRQAIITTNSGGCDGVIFFNIGGPSPHVITVTSALPVITKPVLIDARSQPVYVGVPLVELNAGPAGLTGLSFAASAFLSEVHGLSITEFNIGIQTLADDVSIENNYIGLKPDGTLPAAPGATGIFLNPEATYSLVDGNLISGNTSVGVLINSVSGNTGDHTISHNRIGTTPDGLVARPNGTGVRITSAKALLQENIISGNSGHAVEHHPGGGAGAPSVRLQTNLIGLSAAATPLGNGGAAFFTELDQQFPPTIGVQLEQNTMANNGGGVYVLGPAGVEITGNSIYDNGGLGIDLLASGIGGPDGNDPNDADPTDIIDPFSDYDGVTPNYLQNFPDITQATTDGANVWVDGTFDGVPGQSFRLEFFSNSACDASTFGEGKTFLGSVNVNTAGDGTNAPFAFEGVLPGGETIVTATAIDIASGNTSEFSPCKTSVAAPTVTIDDLVVNEGVGNAVVTLHRSAATIHTEVELSTQESTATDVDFTPTITDAVFAPGQLTTTASIPITDDNVDEVDEAFFLELGQPYGGVLGDGGNVITITDNDVPQLSIDDVNVAENGGSAILTVSSSIAPAVNVGFHAQTSDVSATAGADYTTFNANGTILAGQLTTTVTVPILDDPDDEVVAETFNVTLSAPTNATIADAVGVVTIADNETPQLSINDIAIAENGGSAILTVSSSLAPVANVTFHAKTFDGGATAGADYTAFDADATILAAQLTTTITVPILNDTADELAETFTVKLSAAIGATIVDDTGVVTINDNDVPQLSINDVIIAENGGSALLTVSTNIAPVVNIGFHAQTSNVNATAGSDFTTFNANGTILAGQFTTTVSVPIINDTADEVNETFRVNLSAPTNAAIADSFGVVTITDNDVPQLSINDVSISEGGGSAVLTVSSNIAPVANAGFHATTSGGNATAGADYTTFDANASITAGQLTTTVTVPILDDPADELAETFNVTLTLPTNSAIADATGVVTITDDDVPQLSIDDILVAEDGVSAVLTVTSNIAPVVNAEFHFKSSDGNATAGDDYTVTEGDNAVLPGQLTTNVFVPILEDDDAEPPETFNVTLSAPEDAAFAKAVGVVTIEDNELPQLSINDVSIAEGGGSAVLTVTASFPVGPLGAFVLVETADVSATAGADYTTFAEDAYIDPGQTTTQVSIPILEDTLDEIDETFTATLSAPAFAEVDPGDDVGTVTITDNDLPQLSINDVSIAEDGGSAVLTVSSNIAPVAVVGFHAQTSDGSALVGSDYTLYDANGSIGIGQMSTTVTIPILEDAVDELAETFNVTLSAPSNGAIADGVGVVTITDNEIPKLSINDVSIAEGGGSAVLTVSSNIAPVIAAGFHAQTSNGTATAGSDFTTFNANGAVPAGQLSTTISVPIADDALDELDETFTVTLSGETNAELADAVGVVTITDTDEPQLSINNVSVAETGGSVVLTVLSDKAVAQNVTVHLATADASATDGADYTGVPDVTVTILTGATSGTTSVTILDDAADEINETFGVTLSNATNANIADATATVTIIDDETPQLSINDVTISEDGSTAVLTVSSSFAPGVDVGFHAQTSNGSAAAGSDFTTFNANGTVLAGQLTTTISVGIIDDLDDEPNETFNVTLSAPTNAGIADGVGAVTITDNDEPPPPTTTTTTTLPPPTTTTTTTVPPTTTTTATTTTTTTTTTSTTTVPPAPTSTMPDVVVIPAVTAAPTTTARPTTTTTRPTTTTTVGPTTTTTTMRPTPTTTEPPPPEPTVEAPSLTARTHDGETHGVAGVRVNVQVLAVPAGVDQVYIDVDETRIGALDTTSDRRADGSGLSMPGDASPGAVAVTASQHVDGSFPFARASFVIDEGLHRSNLSTSVPQPSQISFKPTNMLRSAAVGGGLVALLFFPAEIFDSTFAAHHQRILAPFRRRKSSTPRVPSRARRHLTTALCALGGGALFTALMSPLGFNAATAMTMLGCTVAVVAVDFGLAGADYFYVKQRHGHSGHLRAVPAGLVIGALCVAAAKLVGFEPGYVYGIVAAWVFGAELTRQDRGRMAVMTTFAMLALSVICLFLRVPVSSNAGEAGASPVWIGIEACLTGTFLLAIESAVISLIPMRSMRGHAIWQWNKWVWAATTVVTAAVFAHILVNPGSGVISSGTEATQGVAILLGLFGLASVGFWAWFHFRPDPHVPQPPSAAAVGL